MEVHKEDVDKKGGSGALDSTTFYRKFQELVDALKVGVAAKDWKAVFNAAIDITQMENVGSFVSIYADIGDAAEGDDLKCKNLVDQLIPDLLASLDLVCLETTHLTAFFEEAAGDFFAPNPFRLHSDDEALAIQQMRWFQAVLDILGEAASECESLVSEVKIRVDVQLAVHDLALERARNPMLADAIEEILDSLVHYWNQYEGCPSSPKLIAEGKPGRVLQEFATRLESNRRPFEVLKECFTTALGDAVLAQCVLAKHSKDSQKMPDCLAIIAQAAYVADRAAQAHLRSSKGSQMQMMEITALCDEVHQSKLVAPEIFSLRQMAPKMAVLHEDWKHAVEKECKQVETALGHMTDFVEKYKLIEGAALKWEFTDCAWVYAKKEDLDEDSKATFKRVEQFVGHGGQYDVWQQRFSKCSVRLGFGDEETNKLVTDMVLTLKSNAKLLEQVSLIQALNVVVPVLLETIGTSPKLTKALRYCTEALKFPETSFPDHVRNKMIEAPTATSAASSSQSTPEKKTPPKKIETHESSCGNPRAKKALKKLT